MMARKSDYIVAKWWKENADKYSIEDLSCLDFTQNKKLKISIDYTDYDTGKSIGHRHDGE